MTKYVPIVTVLQAQKEAQRRAGECGVKLMFDHRCEVPYATSKGEIVIPEPKFPMDERAWIKYRAALIHEPLHIQRKEAFTLFEESKLPVGHPIHSIWNAVEDDVMERNHLAVYYGDRVDMQADRLLELQEGLAQLKSDPSIDITDKETQRVMILGALVNTVRERWHPESVAGHEQLIELLTDESKETLSKLLNNKDIIDSWLQAEDVKTPFEVAKRIYDVLWEADGKNSKDEIAQAQQNASNKETKEGDSGTEGKEHTKGKNKKEGKVPWYLLETSNHDERSGLMSGNPVSIDWTKKRLTRSDAIKYTPPEYVDDVRPSSRNSYNNGTLDDRTLANHIRKLIQASRRVYAVPEQLSGKLKTKELYRLAVPLTPGSDWNFRIFAKKKPIEKINTAVTVLVDWSGSMDMGEKKELCVAALTQINNVFSTVLRVPMSIVSFTSYGYRPQHLKVKDFDKQVTPDYIGRMFTSWDDHSYGNADGDSVMGEALNLLRRKEERKIMIVLSDGCPADGLTDPDSLLRTTVAELITNNKMEIYGIGMQDDSVTRYYGKNARVVNNMTDLNKVLLETLTMTVSDVLDVGGK